MCESRDVLGLATGEKTAAAFGAGAADSEEIQTINLQLSKHSTKWRFETIIRIIAREGGTHFHLPYLDKGATQANVRILEGPASVLSKITGIRAIFL